jgi:hypothetical protein
LIPESQSRPADVFIPNWHNGTAAALDVCIVAPARSNPNSPAKGFVAHLDSSFIGKLDAHADDCKEVGLAFHPIVFTTGGAIHPKLLSTLERIAELSAGRAGLSPSSVKKQFFNRLGVAIQKGNAYCIHTHLANAQNRLNNSPDADDDDEESLISS